MNYTLVIIIIYVHDKNYFRDLFEVFIITNVDSRSLEIAPRIDSRNCERVVRGRSCACVCVGVRVCVMRNGVSASSPSRVLDKGERDPYFLFHQS